MRYLLSTTTALMLLSISTAQAQNIPETKLTASDGATGDKFGESVAISDGTVIVGAPNDGDNGTDSGSAYVFNLATGGESKLTAGDGTSFDFFGGTVAISEGTAIVGALGGNDATGAAYMYDVATGVETKLTASDGADFDLFGSAVAISDGVALVGSPHDADNGQFSGSAYLFDLATSAETKLTASDGAEFDRFGDAVAISGGTAIVGAWGGDAAPGSRTGSAYLFNVATGAETKLTASDGSTGDRFGEAVAISGGTAIVGARYDFDNGSEIGSAYLFDLATGAETKLTASDGSGFDRFGTSVAISDRLAIVGATEDDDNGSASGSAYLFDVSTGIEVAKLTASDGTENDFFGSSVAIDGTTAVVGANGKLDDTGAAYVYDLTPRWSAAFGGAYDAASNWAGLAPSLIGGFDTFINPDTTQTITGPSGTSEVGAFALGEGAGRATLNLRAGGGIIAADGVTIGARGKVQGSGGLVGDIINAGEIVLDRLALAGPVTNSGLVKGSGVLPGTFDNLADGEIRLAEGDRLDVLGNATNAGSINAFGAVAGPGTRTVLDFRSGLTNTGRASLLGGQTTVFGNVDNSGRLANGDGGKLVLFDDLVNSGIFHTGMGAKTVVAGDYSGAGSLTGGGTVMFEGNLSTGASPSLIDFGVDVDLTSAGTTTMELAGLVRGDDYDAWDVTGSLTLGGTLDLVNLDGFLAGIGDSFTLFNATDGISGSFGSINYAPLGSGLWTEVRTANSYGFAVTPTTAPVPLPAGIWLMASGLGLLWLRRRA